MEEELKEYQITMEQKIQSKKAVLDDAYFTCTSDEEPELIYITAGPGAGKSSAERYFQKKLFLTKAIIPFIFNSDKLATYHPKSDKALKTLLPQIYYKVTRWFVRPAAPILLNELRKSRISLINENTLDHGESDIEEAKKFKENGYKIKANVIATDIFVSRLSCFEREAEQLRNGSIPRGISKESQERMYNSFEPTIRELDRLGLLDEINVFTRGKTVKDDPILIYSKGDIRYKDFKEAIDVERRRQRDLLLKSPEKYFERIQRAKETISELGENEELTQNALNGLDDLEKDFAREVLKHKREQAKKLLEKSGDLTGQILDMVLVLSNEHRVENGEDVCEYIEEIEEKYGLRYSNGSEMGKLYTELERESDDNDDFWRRLAEGNGKFGDVPVSKENVNSDDKIFEDPNATQDGVVKAAKEKMGVYDMLLKNAELSNYSKTLLLGKLQEIKKRYEYIENELGGDTAMHPTVEDFRELD